MACFDAKMHQIRFQLELHPKLRSTDPLAGFWGLTSKVKEGEWRDNEGREGAWPTNEKIVPLPLREACYWRKFAYYANHPDKWCRVLASRHGQSSIIFWSVKCCTAFWAQFKTIHKSAVVSSQIFRL